MNDTRRVAFETLCLIAMESCNTFTSLHYELTRYCPNKKVVHLAKHANKLRVRKKNFNRAMTYWRK